jgi:hypothetical protein
MSSSSESLSTQLPTAQLPTTHLRCPDCGKICKTNAALKSHVKSHADMHKKANELNQVIASSTLTTDQLRVELQKTQEENAVLKQHLRELKAKMDQITPFLERKLVFKDHLPLIVP